VTLAGLAVFYGSATGQRGLDWQPYSTRLVSEAQARQQPVLVEFTADWCINCKLLEKTVYADAGVVAAARSKNLMSLQLDMTRPNAKQRALLQRLGGAGLPFALLFDRQGRVVARFPDLFQAEELIRAIDRAGGKI